MKLNKRYTRLMGLILLATSCLSFAAKKIDDTHNWSATEVATLKSLWIGSLQPPPPDPSNKFADDPEAARLGHLIFFDKRFSANGKIACVSCHLPEKAFTDGLGRAKGLGTTQRGAPTLIGAAYSPWFFWDGRSDSQWSQAMGPLENQLEHGSSRTRIAHIIYEDQAYRKQYESIFVRKKPARSTTKPPPKTGRQCPQLTGKR
jgi:cytochrome c peroxidase